MSKENLLRGAPRMHGELLTLGIEVAESTAARYMARRLGIAGLEKTLVRNHAADIA
jgi:hypothetical protein